MTAGDDPPLTPSEGAAILERLARGSNGGSARDANLARTAAIVEARYRALVEQIPAVTFMASLEGGLSNVYVSPQIEALLGFSQEEWMSDPVLWFRQLHPDDRALWNEEFARGCATGRRSRRGQAIALLENRLAVLDDEDGDAWGVVGDAVLLGEGVDVGDARRCGERRGNQEAGQQDDPR